MDVWSRRMFDETFWLCHPLGRSKSIDPAAPAACCELACGSIRPAWGERGATPEPPAGWPEGAAGAAVLVSATLGGAALDDASGAGAAVSRLPQAQRLNRIKVKGRARAGRVIGILLGF